MLSGEYNVTLDDTGRIALPRKLRDILDMDKVVLTRGADECLWLYPPEQWDLFQKDVFDATDQFTREGRRQRLRFIGSRQDVDIDRQGRILIPPSLREHAGLSKSCVVLGQIDYIEIWDEDRYKAYLDADNEAFWSDLEKLHAKIKQKKEMGQ